MKKLATKMLARAGIVAGLYAAITLLLFPISYGIIQFRPAEALTLLPMFFAETPMALFIGCMIANIVSGNIYDIFLGSLITLVAGYLTRLISKKIRNPFIAGIPPIILNALFLPLIFWLAGGKDAYWITFASLLLSQTLSIYIIGVPMFYGLEKLRKNGNRLLNDEPLYNDKRKKSAKDNHTNLTNE